MERSQEDPLSWLDYTEENARSQIMLSWANQPTVDLIKGQLTPAQMTHQARCKFFGSFGLREHFRAKNPEPLDSDKSPLDISIPKLRSVGYAPNNPVLASQKMDLIEPVHHQKRQAPSSPPALPAGESPRKKLKTTVAGKESESKQEPNPLPPMSPGSQQAFQLRGAPSLSARHSSDSVSGSVAPQDKPGLRWPSKCKFSPLPADEIGMIVFDKDSAHDLYGYSMHVRQCTGIKYVWFDHDIDGSGRDTRVWLTGPRGSVAAAKRELTRLHEELEASRRQPGHRSHRRH